MTKELLAKAKSYSTEYSLTFLERRAEVFRGRIMAGANSPELQANDLTQLQVISMAIALKSVLMAGR